MKIRARKKYLYVSWPSIVVERCRDTGLYVGHVPGIIGAHTQAASKSELKRNISEVVRLCNMDINRVANAIAADLGEPLPDLREALTEFKASLSGRSVINLT